MELKDQGNKLFGAKDFENARQVYLQAVEEDSSLVSLFTNLAACEIYMKRYQEALQFTAKARIVDPEWIKTYFREGEAYNALEQYAEAAGSFWECLKREPNNKLFKDLFNIAMAKGKVQYAISNK